MAAMVVNPAAFTSARHFSASLGIVPRQDSTGGKAVASFRRTLLTTVVAQAISEVVFEL